MAVVPETLLAERYVVRPCSASATCSSTRGLWGQLGAHQRSPGITFAGCGACGANGIQPRLPMIQTTNGAMAIRLHRPVW